MVQKTSDNIRIFNRRKNKRITEVIQTNIAESKTEETGQEKIKVDVGLDASSSCIGVCILETGHNKLVDLYSIKLTSSKFIDIFDKIIFLRKEFDKLKKYDIQNVYIEEPALKFSKGKSSAHTIALLAKMNVLVCYEMLLKFNKKPTYINVNTGRKKLSISIDKKDKSITNKQKVFNMVRNLNPNFPWITKKAINGKFKGQIVYDKINEDMADSWVIARSGQLSCVLNDKNKRTIR